MDKLEGSWSAITFFGIELDARQRIIVLPIHKLEELQSVIIIWVGRKPWLKWDLETISKTHIRIVGTKTTK